MLADEAKNRGFGGFDCSPKRRGNRVAEDTAESFDPIDRQGRPSEPIGKVILQEKKPASREVSLSFDLLFTRGTECLLSIAMHRGFMPGQDAVADLMSFSPSLFLGRQLLIDQYALAVRNPERFKIPLLDGVQQ